MKARIARHQGRAFRSAPLAAHLSYLKREGVTRDGEKARMFDADTDSADDARFRRAVRGRPASFPLHRLARGRRRDDRPQGLHARSCHGRWRRTSARDSTGSPSITGTPTIRTSILLVRGVDRDGNDLVISRDYISHGLRSRAEDLVSIELGPKPERDIRPRLEREIDAERWTRLDVEIRIAADETGYIDLATASPRRRRRGLSPPDDRPACRSWSAWGSPHPAGPGEWMVGLEAERTLRDLGLRGDIIKTMHRAFTERGHDRGIGDYVIDDRHGGLADHRPAR